MKLEISLLFFGLAGMSTLRLASGGVFQDTLQECMKGDVSGNCENGPYCFGFSMFGTSAAAEKVDKCEEIDKFSRNTADCNAFGSVKKIGMDPDVFEVVLVGRIGGPAGWVGIGFSKAATIMGPDTVTFICSMPDAAIHKYIIDTKEKVGTSHGLDDVSTLAQYVPAEGKSVVRDGGMLVCKFRLKNLPNFDLKSGLYYVGVAGHRSSGLANGKFPMHQYFGKSKVKPQAWSLLKVKGKEGDNRSGKVTGSTLTVLSIGLGILWLSA